MVARTYLPFCSLLMKIMVLESVRPPTDGKILACLRPLSMISLQASKSHSSKAPKSEYFPHVASSGHGLATPELQTTSTQPIQPSSQDDRLSTLIEGLYQHISRFERVLYFTNNQVQMCLTTIKTQLDVIQQKLEDSL